MQKSNPYQGNVVKAREVLDGLRRKLSLCEVKGENAEAEKVKDMIARAEEWVVEDA